MWLPLTMTLKKNISFFNPLNTHNIKSIPTKTWPDETEFWRNDIYFKNKELNTAIKNVVLI